MFYPCPRSLTHTSRSLFIKSISLLLGLLFFRLEVMLALPLVLLPSLLPSLTLAKTPYVVAWNRTHSYGPDGPWPVVTVQVGSREDGGTLSWVDLHPGGIWQTMIPTEAFCNSPKSPNPCLAEKAGLYNLNSSTFLLRNFTNETATIWQWGSERAFNMSGLTNNVLDGMSLYTVQGGVTVGNGTISAVDRSQISLPDGTNYSTQVGSLSLGCPGGGSQAFEGTNFTGGTFPGKLRGVNVIASNSFGLHYGSVALGQVGSLVWGGYDQNRILGDVATFDLNNKNGMLSSLVDIQIGVETGLSPFGANVYEGLLRADPTFGGTQPTLINPVVPYFFMSKETCAAIAQNLPVTFQPSIGLYTWNIMDAQFEKIVRSPAFLGFIFQAKGGRNITIKVPFRLLNLTLEAPIVSSPQQYFPCRPFTNSEGNYFLGRAFLQAAYIGINWEISRWFLGQAPGKQCSSGLPFTY